MVAASLIGLCSGKPLIFSAEAAILAGKRTDPAVSPENFRKFRRVTFIIASLILKSMVSD